MNEANEFSRREALRLGLSGAAAVLAAPAWAETTAQASGRVILQPEGTGLRDVLVSNGREVTTTDADGRWRLPAPEPCVFFVIKPSGHMTPVDPQTGSPRFYYLHSPKARRPIST